MGKKRTREEVEEIVNNFGCILIKYFIKNNEKFIEIQNKYGYLAEISLNSFIRRKGRFNFVDKRNPHSLKNISLWIKINNKTFMLNKENIYLGCDKKLSFYCSVCNENFYMSWEDIFQNRGCAICSGKQIGKRNSLKYLNSKLSGEWISSENNLKPENVTEFSNEKVLWCCSLCGHNWNATVSDRSGGTGCPACSGRIATNKNRLSIFYPELIDEWHYLKNKNLTPDQFSFGSGTKIWWKCKTCNNIWIAEIRERALRNTGCPKCQSSHGEKEIRKYLENNNIEFIHQHKFIDCKYIKTLRFDFFIPKLNLIIEYHGQQHYFPVDFSGKGKEWAEREFIKNKKRDKIKEKYCTDNKITLLIISYTEYKNINNIILNFITT